MAEPKNDKKPKNLSAHSLEEISALRARLEMISLGSLLFTDLLFVIAWLWSFPGLPWYIPTGFVAGSLLLWLVLVQPAIYSFGRPKK